MTRQRIADTLLALVRDCPLKLDITWLYAPSSYSETLSDKSLIRVNEPARGFEGWGDPVRSLVCVVGAGFEGDLALGVIDALEPADNWVMLPFGYSDAHDRRIDDVNARVSRAVAAEHLLRYRVDQPYETLLRLDSLCEVLRADSRVVVVPLGPKIFALLSFVVALRDPRNVSVWRVSADSGRSPVDCRAIGDVVGIRTRTQGSGHE